MVFYIYKLKGVNYIGSTNNLVDRQRIHNKRCYKDKKDLKLYNHLRANNIKIEIILLAVYNRKCSNKIKKLVEQYWINKYDSNNNGLNVYRAFRSKKQKKEQQRLGQEKFRKNHKNKIKKYKAAYKKKHGNASAYTGTKTKAGLTRWYKEDWRTEKGKKTYKEGGTIFRPTKRITKKTPATMSELTKKQKASAIKEKKRTGKVKKYKK